MRIDASAGRNPKADLRDCCAKLSLRATCTEEAEHLAAIYRVMVFGGRMTIEVKGTAEPLVAEYGEAE